MATPKKSIMQRIFDRGCKHLMKQGRKSVEGHNCRYLSDNGQRCIIGGCIAKKYYTEAIEGQGARTVLVRSAVAKSMRVEPHEIDDGTASLMAEMQNVHDYTLSDDAGKFLNMEKLKQKLRNIAAVRKLAIPACIKA